MPVIVILRDQEFEVQPGLTLALTLKKLDLLPEMHLALREGNLITEDEVLRDGDRIKLVAVISGGNGVSR